MGVNQSGARLDDEAPQPQHRAGSYSISHAGQRDHYSSLHELRHELHFPWQQVGDLVVEPGAVPMARRLGDELLGATDAKTFDDDEDDGSIRKRQCQSSISSVSMRRERPCSNGTLGSQPRTVPICFAETRAVGTSPARAGAKSSSVG